MKAVVDGKRYDTDKMEMLWYCGRDGAGVGRETEIYITFKSRTIVQVNITCWQGEKDSMAVLSLVQCMEQYPDCAEWLPDDVLASISEAE